MLLDANVFKGIVHSMESESRRGTRGQRREPRVLLCTRMTILPCPNGIEAGVGVPLSVPVRDLSRGGLRFLLPRRLPLDTQFVVLLPNLEEVLDKAVVDATELDAVTAAVTVGAQPQSSPHPEHPLAMLCSVAYWQPLAKDVFAIGGQFMQPVATLKVPTIAPRIVLPGAAEGDGAAEKQPSFAERVAS